MPAREPLRRCLQGREHGRFIEFDKRGVPQLRAGLRPGAWPGRLRGRARAELLEKLVQMELERLEGFPEHQQHDVIKRQLALPGKGSRRDAMARHKAAIAQKCAHRFDDQNSRRFGLHPHPEMKSR